MSTTHYSRLGCLVSQDAIPPFLSFVEGGLDSIFSKLFYKNLIINNGLGIFNYQLTLVTFDRLEMKLPGVEGVKLVFFDGSSSSSSSEIGLSLSVQLPILKYTKGFELSGFNFADPTTVYNLLLDLSGVEISSLLNEAINVFYVDATDPVQAFVDEYNTFYPNLTNPLTKSSSTDNDVVIADLISQIEAHYIANEISGDAFNVIYEVIVETNPNFSLQESFEILFN